MTGHVTLGRQSVPAHNMHVRVLGNPPRGCRSSGSASIGMMPDLPGRANSHEVPAGKRLRLPACGTFWPGTPQPSGWRAGRALCPRAGLSG